MDFREFINNLSKEPGLRSYMHFETIIYKILELHLQQQNKKILHYGNDNISDNFIDFFLPDGINEYNGPTGIIIKFVKNNINSYFATIRKVSEKIKVAPSFKALLFILASDIPDEKKVDLANLASKITGLKIDVWDMANLSEIANNYTEYLSETINNIEKVFVNNVISKSLEGKPNQWKENRKEYIKQLNTAYINDDLVLFLGAGVSIGANIAGWNELVTDLLVTMISEKLKDNGIIINADEQNLIIDQIKTGNSSPLLQARYIRTGLDKMFTEVVTKILYNNINNSNSGTSALLKSLTRLCAPRRSSIGIRGVITYNFDDLLEFHLKESNISHLPIYRETDTCSQDELSIYHVHGFLPREATGYDELSENLLVFSEEGYHAVMLDPYCWSNITQLNFLRENTCLMVGLSLIDPNLRRLLDIAARKTHKPKHFAILKRQTLTDKLKNSTITLKALNSFLTVDQELQEKSFRELGLNIIWVDSYEEIPGILDSIRK